MGFHMVFWVRMSSYGCVGWMILHGADFAEVLKQLGHFRHLFVKCVAQASKGDRGSMPWASTYIDDRSIYRMLSFMNSYRRYV